MGQYWTYVNLDKKECINNYALGSGAKLWEQLANQGPGAALIVLLAGMTSRRGGGDFDMDKNWHGPERTFPEHNCSPGQMPDNYPLVAGCTIGRWAGDRIIAIGDYAKPDDYPELGDLPAIYEYANCAIYGKGKTNGWKDITPQVVAVIAHELNDRYTYEDGKLKYIPEETKMSKMKDFGIWLATLIYVKKANNDEIRRDFALTYGEPSDEWLNTQIVAVRGNPSIYQDLAGKPTNG